ncbi:MAG: phosphoadenylyl-sulfate reductase [Actinomycetota bacterium]|nr:phosphoadenylyl-sulfate reductase [Actinomycetota bacterium]
MNEHLFVDPSVDPSALQEATPRAVLTWAVESLDRLAVATSFQASGLVILHHLREIKPDLPVLFLDTGFHFEETLRFRDRIAEMWDLKIVTLRGGHGNAANQAEIYGPELYRRSPDTCCGINKVKPLQAALEEYDGWISGLRRDQSPLRSETPIIEAQLLPSGNEIMKIHPLARWNKSDVDAYISEHGIPTHPLFEQGYRSIGCWPCTRAVQPGEDERAGRWEGLAKTECGIHSFGKIHGPQQSEAEQ